MHPARVRKAERIIEVPIPTEEPANTAEVPIPTGEPANTAEVPIPTGEPANTAEKPGMKDLPSCSLWGIFSEPRSGRAWRTIWSYPMRES